MSSTLDHLNMPGHVRTMKKRDAEWMHEALMAAQNAAERGEVPVGAVVVGPHGECLAVASNLTESNCDPSAHAEILALREAGQKLRSPRLLGCDLFVTLEPCAMCAQAISHARIRRVVFGAYDPKSGGVEHGARVYTHATCHHAPEVIGGVLETDAAKLLKAFFSRPAQLGSIRNQLCPLMAACIGLLSSNFCFCSSLAGAWWFAFHSEYGMP